MKGWQEKDLNNQKVILFGQNQKKAHSCNVFETVLPFSYKIYMPYYLYKQKHSSNSINVINKQYLFFLATFDSRSSVI